MYMYVVCVVGIDAAVCKWRAVLPAMMAGNKAYAISASNEKQVRVVLNDVLFGDVWVCGGQSNMQFAVSQVNL